MMNRHTKYRQFWRSIAKEPQIQNQFIPLIDTDEEFIWFRWGKGAAPFGVTFHRPGCMITNLCLNCRGKRAETKKLFDALERDRSKIDKEFKKQFDEEFKKKFGEPPDLVWERRPDMQESWVSVYRMGVSIHDDPVSLEATKKWAIHTIIALKNVFCDRLNRLLP
jgi:hypothetical protein